jgi:hypothetical protein
MTGACLNPVRTPTDFLARSAWLLLGGIHVPILFRSSATLLAEPGWEQGAKWSLVVLSLAFFGAKALGLRLFDVRCRRTAAVAFLVACGLVHGPVRERALADQPPAVTAVLVVAGSAAAALASRRRLERISSTAAAARAVLLASVWARMESNLVAVGRTVTDLRTGVPRGPPRGR